MTAEDGGVQRGLTVEPGGAWLGTACKKDLRDLLAAASGGKREDMTPVSAMDFRVSGAPWPATP